METDLNKYEEHSESWKGDAFAQLEHDFKDKVMNNFVKKRVENREREIRTIADQSSRYYQDLTSLQQEAYIRVAGVFYNFDRA